jgi:hypothetical protein
MKAACCGMILVVASFFLGTAPAHAILVTVEADDFALGTDLSTAVAGVTLSAFSGPPIVGAGDPLLSNKVLSSLPDPFSPSLSITGDRVFGNESTALGINGLWYAGDHQFRTDFDVLTHHVSIMTSPDGEGDTDPTRFEIYGLGGILLDAINIPGTSLVTVTFDRPTADIAYMIATNPNPTPLIGESFLLDQLIFDNEAATVPEPDTLLLFGAGLLAVTGLRRFTSKGR